MTTSWYADGDFESADARRPRVACDDNCGAYAEPNPDSLEELRAALDHWENHGYLSGCSHGQ